MAINLRSSYWSTAETKCLVSSWKEAMIANNINELPVIRNSYLYIQVADMMKKNGYKSKTWKQCRTKIKGLVSKYRKMKDGNRVSGTDRKDCPYYEDFDSVLGTRAATRPPVLLESCEPSTVAALPDAENDFNRDIDGESNYSASPELLPIDEDEQLIDNVEQEQSTDAAQEQSTDAVQPTEKKNKTSQTRKKGGTNRGKNSAMEEMMMELEKRADEREERLIKTYTEIDNKRREEERAHELQLTRLVFSFMERLNTPSSYQSQYTTPYNPNIQPEQSSSSYYYE